MIEGERRMGRLSRLLGTVALAGILPWSYPALAQQSAATDGALAIPEVEVQATAWRAWQPVQGYVAPVTTTGTKTDTPLIEAPQSVGVVTRDQMDDQAPQSISEALRYTAGVISEVRPSPRYDSVFVRGFGGQGTGAAFVNFLDGLRVGRGANYAVPNFDPWLLERIEVLRGPASVLYGQTGAGGLVNLVSRRPTETPIHEVRLEAGSEARMQTAFDFGGPLTADGTFQYRLTGIGRISDTQYDYVGEKRVAIAPAFTWRPSADTTVTVLAGFQDDPELGFYNFTPARGTVFPSPYGRLPSSFFPGDPNWQKEQRRQAWIGYQLEHRLDDTWTVRQNARYMNIDSERRVLSIASIGADGRTATRRALHAIEHANTLALDNQAQATFSTGPLRHTLLGGLDWSATWSNSRVGVGTAPSIDIFAPVYYRTITGPTMGPSTQTDQDTDQVGLYLQDQIALDRFRFNIGVRHDWANTDTETRSTGAHAKQDDQEWTWRVGGLYLFDNGIAPYASYSTSFLPNSGTQAPQRGSGTFEATTGEQYEVGVKYQPPGRSSFVQLAAYQITQDNVLTPDPVYTTFNISTGRIRSQGIELDARASLTDNIDLIGAYSYTNAEIRRSNTAGVAGNQVPQVPHHSASGWVNYRVTDGALRGLELGGGVRYIGETYGNETNTFKVDDFTLFDAAIRYDFGARFEQMRGLSLAVNASNLADKEYISSCNNELTCYYGTRRLVLASLRMRW